MAKSVIRTLLVIGENPDEKVKLYDASTIVEPYLKYKYADRAKMHAKQIHILDSLLTSPYVKLSNTQKEIFKNLYLDTKEMDDDEFFETISEGLTIDPKTGDAYSDLNPDGKFLYPKCYQGRWEHTGQEAEFSSPFHLKDGSKSYRAKMGEIDWNRMHMYNTGVYESAWEVCVERREPKTDTEKQIYNAMKERTAYFANFSSKEEYVAHSCSFFTACVITADGKYHGIDMDTSDKEWVRAYYDKYIKGLDDNLLLSIYEVRTLED